MLTARCWWVCWACIVILCWRALSGRGGSARCRCHEGRRKRSVLIVFGMDMRYVACCSACSLGHSNGVASGCFHAGCSPARSRQHARGCLLGNLARAQMTSTVWCTSNPKPYATANRPLSRSPLATVKTDSLHTIDKAISNNRGTQLNSSLTCVAAGLDSISRRVRHACGRSCTPS